MAISYTWDASWETIPTDQLVRGDMRNVIGQIAQYTRERMEVEHQFGPNTPEDTGRHYPGHVAVTGRGVADPVVNLQAGELFIKDVAPDVQLRLYGDVGAGVQWNQISTLDHAILNDRNIGDPHTIYMRRSGDDIRPNELKMGGKMLRVTGAMMLPTFGGLLKYFHSMFGQHPTLGETGAITNGVVLAAKLSASMSTQTYSGTVPNNAVSYFDLGNYAFFPEITIKVPGATPIPTVRIVGGSAGYGVGVLNNSGSPVSFQARWRRL